MSQQNDIEMRGSLSPRNEQVSQQRRQRGQQVAPNVAQAQQLSQQRQHQAGPIVQQGQHAQQLQQQGHHQPPPILPQEQHGQQQPPQMSQLDINMDNLPTPPPQMNQALMSSIMSNPQFQSLINHAIQHQINTHATNTSNIPSLPPIAQPSFDPQVGVRNQQSYLNSNLPSLPQIPQIPFRQPIVVAPSSSQTGQSAQRHQSQSQSQQPSQSSQSGTGQPAPPEAKNQSTNV